MSEGRPRGVRACAPGRITVFLAVGHADDHGRHRLAGATQAVSLHDEVYVVEDEGFTVVVDQAEASARLPAPEQNIVVHAARLLARELGRTDGVRLHLTKRIPTGGLGASAADAAATLIACDALWEAGLSAKSLRALAARLRPDVPFALAGGTAVGSDGGDMSRALASGRFHWVTVTPDVHVSADAVYRELEQVRADASLPRVHVEARPSVFPPVLQALRRGDAHLLARAGGNDLETAVLRCCPSLDDMIDLGLSSGALTGLVSGTGPALAFLAEDASAARQLQEALSGAGLTATHVHGPVSGARVMDT